MERVLQSSPLGVGGIPDADEPTEMAARRVGMAARRCMDRAAAATGGGKPRPYTGRA